MIRLIVTTSLDFLLDKSFEIGKEVNTNCPDWNVRLGWLAGDLAFKDSLITFIRYLRGDRIASLSFITHCAIIRILSN